MLCEGEAVGGKDLHFHPHDPVSILFQSTTLSFSPLLPLLVFGSGVILQLASGPQTVKEPEACL